MYGSDKDDDDYMESCNCCFIGPPGCACGAMSRNEAKQERNRKRESSTTYYSGYDPDYYEPFYHKSSYKKPKSVYDSLTDQELILKFQETLALPDISKKRVFSIRDFEFIKDIDQKAGPLTSKQRGYIIVLHKMATGTLQEEQSAKRVWDPIPW